MDHVFQLDPLRDPRWETFVGGHPQASAFHTPGWLRALQKTYGYQPMAFTTAHPDEPLRNGVVFCEVRSWLTGTRLVSLPFSDHCEPLVESDDDLDTIQRFIERSARRHGWKYVEMRSARSSPPQGLSQCTAFYGHRVDLRPELDVVHRRFHKDCVQRKIRKAEREGLTYEVGRSEALLEQLYRLLQITRRRHHLPPQPIRWFRILLACLPETACIRVASVGDRPVAGLLTLSHGKQVIYKYGGSDPHFNHLGGMVLLFWKTIQEAKQAGADTLDLGRSDLDNPGLSTFKEHWGAERGTVTCWRNNTGSRMTEGRVMQLSKQLFSRLPDGALALAGRLLYRHIG